MKTKIMVELFGLTDMLQYAEICGFTLARAHARSGESALISGYLGQADTFDKAIAEFSAAYADQSEQDHAVLMKAVRSGDLDVVMEAE
jgi:NAD(P)H-dependent flavin oxidoreductase YrpB (nitropropane dioxygenase family)